MQSWQPGTPNVTIRESINYTLGLHDNADENENHVDDDEDLEELVEGEAGVCRVRAYWLHQGADHLLLVFQTVNILICLYF